MKILLKSEEVSINKIRVVKLFCFFCVVFTFRSKSVPVCWFRSDREVVEL